MNQKKYSNSIEIDTHSAIKNFFIQWRAWLVFSLILACIVAGAKYSGDMKAYNASKAAQPATSEELIKNSTLTSAEMAAVQQAVAQKRLMDNESEYMNSSIYINMNPANVRQLSVIYYVKGIRQADVKDIVSLYLDMLETDESINEIARAGGINADAKYVRELINADTGTNQKNGGTDLSDRSNGIMRITFLLPDEVDADSIDQAIDKLVTGYRISDPDFKDVSLSRVSSNEKTFNNTQMLSDQQNATYSLYNMSSEYSSMTSAFNDEQNNLLNTLIKEQDPDQKKEEDNSQTIVKPSVSKKYAALGFILGIVLYIIIWMVYEISGRSCSIVAGYGISNQLGTIIDTDDQKRNFIFRDRILQKLLYKKQADIDAMIDVIFARAQMNSVREKLDSVEIWTVGYNEALFSVMQKVVSVGQNKGINITIRETSAGHPDEMIDEAQADKSIMLAVKDGVSRKKDAQFLSEMLIMRKTDYLGQFEMM